MLSLKILFLRKIHEERVNLSLNKSGTFFSNKYVETKIYNKYNTTEYCLVNKLQIQSSGNKTKIICYFINLKIKNISQSIMYYKKLIHTSLEVGFPAPCPALVSIRINNGFFCSGDFPALCCNSAINFNECNGTTRSS